MLAQTIIVGALAAVAAAQSSVLSFTRVPNPITCGQTSALTFATNDTSSAVTILLRRGNANDLKTLSTLTSDATDGQYIWTPSDLENGSDYALEIEQGDQVNYYGPFQIQGCAGRSSSSSSATASSTSTTSSSTAYGSGPSLGGGYGSLTLTATASKNGTASLTFTSTVSAGTGVSMSRNATLSSATLTPTSSFSTTATGASSSASGAGYQTTTGSAAPASTGGASITTGGSAIALVLGAVAAILMG